MQVRRALEALACVDRVRLIARSPLYRTAPLGPQDQPEFVNAAAAVLTQLAPLDLLHTLKRIELEQGRAQPVLRWGPRRIDLDLIAYADERMQSARLTLPHPGVSQRNFVLYPLRDVAPELLIPGLGRVSDLARSVPAHGIELLV